MKRLLQSFVAFVCSFAIASAGASPPPRCVATGTASTPLYAEPRDNGVWLPQADADRVLYLLGDCVPALQDYAETQATVLELRAEQVADLRLAVDTATQAQARTQEWGEKGWSAYEAERNRNNSIFREPVFWVVLTLVVSGGIAAGVGYAVSD